MASPRGLLSLLLSISCLLAVQASKCPESEVATKRVVCYYEGTADMDKLNVCSCTDLVFTNAVSVEAYNLTIHSDLKKQEKTAREMKDSMDLFFTVSLKPEEAAAVLKSEDKKITLLNSISSFLRTSDFNGLEINFNLTGDDVSKKEDLVAFLKDLRELMDHHRVKRDGYSVFEEVANDFTTGRYSTEKYALLKSTTPKKRVIKRKKSRVPREDKNVDFYDDDDAEIEAAEEYLGEEPLLKRMKRRKQRVDEEGEQKDTELKTADIYSVWLRLPIRPEVIAKKYDLKALTKYVDYFLVPTDFITDDSEDHLTYHPSRLMGLSDMLNADSVLDLLTGLGAPKEQLIISMPANVFQHELKSESQNTVRSPTTGQIKTITQDTMCSLLKSGNWTVERDEDMTAPYAFSKTTWLAFEDEISANIKAKYIILRDLAGGAIFPIDSDTTSKACAWQQGGRIAAALYNNFAGLARKPRQVVLESLQEQIHDTGFYSQQAGVHLSEYRIVRVVDHSGAVHVIRKNTKTEFECSRQGYFSHPLGCNKFYRCVKFNQYTDDYTVFEYDCPAGLAFDERWEVCVWPGSLPHGAPCTGSSEIAPVPRAYYQCPNIEGYFADPENCRWFFACLDHARDGVTPLTAYEFRCPFGLVFDENTLVCDWPWKVGACGARGLSATIVSKVGGASSYSGTATFNAGAQYINGLLPEQNRASFATVPDYIISGGRISNKAGGVVLNQNIVGGLSGPAGVQISQEPSAIVYGDKIVSGTSVNPVAPSYLVEDGGSRYQSHESTIASVTPSSVLVDNGAADHLSQGGAYVSSVTPSSFFVEDGGSSHRSQGAAYVASGTPSSVFVEDEGSSHRSQGAAYVASVTPSSFFIEDGGSSHRSQGAAYLASVTPSSVLVENGGSRHRSQGAAYVSSVLPASVLVEDGGSSHHSQGAAYLASVTPSSVLVENGGSRHRAQGAAYVASVTPSSVLAQDAGFIHRSQGAAYVSSSTPSTIYNDVSDSEYPVKGAAHLNSITNLTPLRPASYNQVGVSLRPTFLQEVLDTGKYGRPSSQGYFYDKPTINFDVPSIYSTENKVETQTLVTQRPLVYAKNTIPVATLKPAILKETNSALPIYPNKPVVVESYQQPQTVVSSDPPKQVVYQQPAVSLKPVFYAKQAVVSPTPIILQKVVSTTTSPIVYQQEVVTARPIIYHQEISPVITPKPIIYQQQQQIIQNTPRPAPYQEQYLTQLSYGTKQKVEPVSYQHEIQPIVSPKPFVLQQPSVTYQSIETRPIVQPVVSVTSRLTNYQQEAPQSVIYDQKTVIPRPVVHQEQAVTPRPVIYEQNSVTIKPFVYQHEVVHKSPQPVLQYEQIVTPRPIIYKQNLVTPKPIIYQQDVVIPQPIVHEQNLYQKEIVSPQPQKFVTHQKIDYLRKPATPKPVVYQETVVSPKPVVYQQNIVSQQPIISKIQPAFYQPQTITPKPVIYQQTVEVPKTVEYHYEAPLPTPGQQIVQTTSQQPLFKYYPKPPTTPKSVLYEQAFKIAAAQPISIEPAIYQQQTVVSTPAPVVYKQENVPYKYVQKYNNPKVIVDQQQFVTRKPVEYEQSYLTQKQVTQEYVTPRPVVHASQVVTPKQLVYQQEVFQPEIKSTPSSVIYEDVTQKSVVYQQELVTPKQRLYKQDLVRPLLQEVYNPVPVVRQRLPVKNIETISYSQPSVYTERTYTTTIKPIVVQNFNAPNIEQYYDQPEFYQQDIVKVKTRPVAYKQENIAIISTTPRPTFIETVNKLVPKVTYEQEYRPIAVYQTPRISVVGQVQTTPKTVYAESYERVTPSLTVLQNEYVSTEVPLVKQNAKQVRVYSAQEYLPPVEDVKLEELTSQAPIAVVESAKYRINSNIKIAPPPDGYELNIPTTSETPSSTFYTQRIKTRVRVRPTTTETSREYLPPAEPKLRARGRGKTTIVSIGQVDKDEIDEKNLEGVLDKYAGKLGDISEEEKERFVTKVIKGNGRGTIRVGKEPEVSTVGYEITSHRGRSRSRSGIRKFSSSSTTTRGYEEDDIDIVSSTTSQNDENIDSGDVSLATLDLKNLKLKKDKKTVIVVSQVSDANPLLIGKLAGQCSCESNKIELKSRSRKPNSRAKITDGDGNDNEDKEPNRDDGAPSYNLSERRGSRGRKGGKPNNEENYYNYGAGNNNHGTDSPLGESANRGSPRKEDKPSNLDDNSADNPKARNGEFKNPAAERPNENGYIGSDIPARRRGMTRGRRPNSNYADSGRNIKNDDNDGNGDLENNSPVYIGAVFGENKNVKDVNTSPVVIGEGKTGRTGGRKISRNRKPEIYQNTPLEGYPSGQVNVEILDDNGIPVTLVSTTTLLPEVSPSILLPIAPGRIRTTTDPNAVPDSADIVLPISPASIRAKTEPSTLPVKAVGRRIPSRSKVRVPFSDNTSPLLSPITADEIASTVGYGSVNSNDGGDSSAVPSKVRAGAAFDRYGPGGWRGADETLQGSVDCKRPGLFRHPKYCNKFYSCNYDPWKKRYTLSVFNCPVHLAYDDAIGACNWPSKGPACADDNLLV